MMYVGLLPMKHVVFVVEVKLFLLLKYVFVVEVSWFLLLTYAGLLLTLISLCKMFCFLVGEVC